VEEGRATWQKMAPTPVTVQDLKLHPQHVEPRSGLLHGWGLLLVVLITFHVLAFLYWLYLLWGSNRMPRAWSTGDLRDLRDRKRMAKDWMPNTRLLQALKIPGFAKPK